MLGFRRNVTTWAVVTSFTAGCALFTGCSSDDDCTTLNACGDLCGDPTYASAHPDQCPLARADAEAGAPEAGAADGAPSADGGREDAPPQNQSDVSSEDVGDTGTVAAEADVSIDVDASSPTDASVEAPRDVTAEPEAEVCDPTGLPSVSPCVIDERFGVFVSPSGSDTAPGTRAAPFGTLMHAIAIAKSASKRVYACDNGLHYHETVTIDATSDGVSLFGGFACGAWTYSQGSRAQVGSLSGPALLIHSTSMNVLVENFAFSSPDAAAPGDSSIGVIVDSASGVMLRGVSVLAGNGATGRNGDNGGTGESGPAIASAQNGTRATCALDAGGFQGGGFWPAASVICGSKGGNGGGANQGGTGSAGNAGDPSTVLNGGSAGGGNGQPGATGLPGSSGGRTTSVGFFTNMGYSVAIQAGNGIGGSPGQGGGGGGASNAPALTICLGASGGAGGMGGCGGQGGTGGWGGGASVALLIWMSPVTLDGCDLEASNGGSGGIGGDGGAGGMGAAGGMGGGALATDAGPSISAAGNGGPGGNGGSGGPGAGGNGGPSYALAFRGSPPIRINQTTVQVPVQGGGPGGLGGTAPGLAMRAPSGTTGVAATEFAVPTEAGAP